MDMEIGDYIYNKMLDEATHYRWRIIVDRSKRALEIYFAITLEVSESLYLQDVNARVNDSGELIFEDVVCFYSETDPKIVPSNYLVAVPINPKEGVEKGYVDAFIKQLNIAASSAAGQIREFLKDDTRKEFSLLWNEQNMENTIETMKKTNKYSSEPLTFSTDEDESLIEKFKEDDNDGMERI
ncbi:MAG TPA: DUF3013 family protein [Atopostipes sp.]|nr:DUF3013 family protein [Atopostipes sp.]